mgnify:CR=1
MKNDWLEIETIPQNLNLETLPCWGIFHESSPGDA